MTIEWNECSKVLPKIEGNYIVCCWDKEKTIPFIFEGFYCDAVCDYPGGWGNFEGSAIHPTHWMDIPNPPSISNNE